MLVFNRESNDKAFTLDPRLDQALGNVLPLNKLQRTNEAG